MSGPALIIDGNNLLAINTHAHLGLTSPKDGSPTGGLYGTVRKIHAMLLSELGALPSVVYFVKDAGRPDFRVEACATYKTGRKEAREKTKDGEKFYKAYKAQLKVIHQLLIPLGVHVVKAPGFEADDCIAGIVRHGGHADCVIVSGDKDLLQLCRRKNPCVRVYKPTQHEMAKHPGKGYLLQRCLMGDASDNIPGVGGFGEVKAKAVVDWLRDKVGMGVTAEDLIGVVESLEGDPDDVGPGSFPHLKQMRKDWKERRKRIRANWKVMNLKVTSKDAYKAMEVREAAYDPDRFWKVCKRLGFRSLLADRQSFIQVFEDMHGA